MSVSKACFPQTQTQRLNLINFRSSDNTGNIHDCAKLKQQSFVRLITKFFIQRLF